MEKKFEKKGTAEVKPRESEWDRPRSRQNSGSTYFQTIFRNSGGESTQIGASQIRRHEHARHRAAHFAHARRSAAGPEPPAAHDIPGRSKRLVPGAVPRSGVPPFRRAPTAEKRGHGRPRRGKRKINVAVARCISRLSAEIRKHVVHGGDCSALHSSGSLPGTMNNRRSSGIFNIFDRIHAQARHKPPQRQFPA